MAVEKKGESNDPKKLQGPEDLYVVELDERLEFGAAIIDSDLQADDNSGCNNKSDCVSNNNECTNAGCSRAGNNTICTNTSCPG